MTYFQMPTTLEEFEQESWRERAPWESFGPPRIIIPQHMRTPFANYVEAGDRVGHFLTMVLTNDLYGAVARADDLNGQGLGDWVRFLYNYCPSQCWGTAEKVAAWQKGGGLLGLLKRQAAERKERERA